MSTQAPAAATASSVIGTVTVDHLKIAEFREATPTLVKQATDFTIEDANDYEFSLTIAEEAIRRQKAIAEFFAPTKKMANDLHKSITRMEGDMLLPYQQIERLIKDRRMNWRQECERIRQREEDEQRRIARERQQSEALEKAAQLEKDGKKEAAQVVVEQAIVAPAPAVVVPSSVPKQSGSSIRKKFGYRIDDEAQVERRFCSPDRKKIKDHVDAYGMASAIAGVTVFPDENEAIRTKGK